MGSNHLSLAIHGGPPVRSTYLSYGKQHIEPDDIAAVVETLNSAFLTCGDQLDVVQAVRKVVTHYLKR